MIKSDRQVFVGSFLVLAFCLFSPVAVVAAAEKTFVLDSLGNLVYKEPILGISQTPLNPPPAVPGPPKILLNTDPSFEPAGPNPAPSSEFVFSADKYELINQGGEIRVRAYEVKEASQTAKNLDLPRHGRKLSITTEGEGFDLVDGGVIAHTRFPLTIKRDDQAVSVITPGGEREIKLTPSQVLGQLIKNGILSRVELSRKEVLEATTSGEATVKISNSFLQIVETAAGASYKVSGTKEVQLLNFWPVRAGVEVAVDTQSGKVVSLIEPWYLKFFGYLFF